MSRYHEAHFGAALLHCGPHAWHDCVTSTHGKSDDCPINGRYKAKVYSYFFTMFPTMVPQERGKFSYPEHEWTAFWREYLKWVES